MSPGANFGVKWEIELSRVAATRLRHSLFSPGGRLWAAVAKAICGGGRFAGLKPGASSAEEDISFTATNKVPPNDNNANKGLSRTLLQSCHSGFNLPQQVHFAITK